MVFIIFFFNITEVFSLKKSTEIEDSAESVLAEEWTDTSTTEEEEVEQEGDDAIENWVVRTTTEDKDTASEEDEQQVMQETDIPEAEPKEDTFVHLEVDVPERPSKKRQMQSPILK